MKNGIKCFVAGMIIATIVMIGFTNFAATVTQKVDVLLNSAIININGKQLTGENFTYKDKVYVDIEEISEAIGYGIFKYQDSSKVYMFSHLNESEKYTEVGNDLPLGNITTRDLAVKKANASVMTPAIGIKIKFPQGITSMYISSVNGVYLGARRTVNNDKETIIICDKFPKQDRNKFEIYYIINGVEKVQLIEVFTTKEIKSVAVIISKEKIWQLNGQGYSLADIGQSQIYAGLWNVSVEEILQIRGKVGIPDTRKSWDQVKQELGILN